MTEFNKLKRYKKIQGAESLIKSLLNFASSNKKICSIELMESGSFDVTGFVKSFDSNIVTIEQINEYGEQDGISTVELDFISKIQCASPDEQKLKILSDLLK